ncbi:MAG: hypothetical protein WA021_04580 [Minisyncoccia bacterium]
MEHNFLRNLKFEEKNINAALTWAIGIFGAVAILLSISAQKTAELQNQQQFHFFYYIAAKDNFEVWSALMKTLHPFTDSGQLKLQSPAIVQDAYRSYLEYINAKFETNEKREQAIASISSTKQFFAEIKRSEIDKAANRLQPEANYLADQLSKSKLLFNLSIAAQFLSTVFALILGVRQLRKATSIIGAGEGVPPTSDQK